MHSSTVFFEAIILAAGNGDRFAADGSHELKLLKPVLGVPLLIRTLESAARAGICRAHVVVGYQEDRIRAVVEAQVPDGLAVRYHFNPDWHEENGISVLAARPALDGRPFVLLMGDHVFDWRVLRRLMAHPMGAGESLLGVDRHWISPSVAAEATRVKTEAGLVVAIGKDLPDFDGLDTGLFVCDPSVFPALEESARAGDTTLSGGIRRLAGARRVRAVDLGEMRWCDVDTADDLVEAEQVVRSQMGGDR